MWIVKCSVWMVDPPEALGAGRDSHDPIAEAVKTQDEHQWAGALLPLATCTSTTPPSASAAANASYRELRTSIPGSAISTNSRPHPTAECRVRHPAYVIPPIVIRLVSVGGGGGELRPLTAPLPAPRKVEELTVPQLQHAERRTDCPTRMADFPSQLPHVPASHIYTMSSFTFHDLRQSTYAPLSTPPPRAPT